MALKLHIPLEYTKVVYESPQAANCILRHICSCTIYATRLQYIAVWEIGHLL